MREGWVERKFGAIAKWTSGKNLPLNLRDDAGSVPIAGANGQIGRTQEVLYDQPVITVGRVGACGEVHMWSSPVWVSDNALIAIPNPEIELKFLFYALQSFDFELIISGTTQPLITQGKLKEQLIRVPPNCEQRRIVDVIESVDNYITALETRAETLLELSGSLVAAIFQSPESKVVSLGSLCETGGIQIGPFGSQLHASDYVPFGVPSVMPRDLTRNGFDTSSLSYVSGEKASELSKHQVAPGDILFARRGDLSKRALVTDSEAGWLCGTGTVRVRLTGIEPRLAFFALTTPEVNSWLTDHAVGATMPNLNSQIVASIPVRVPTNPELAIAAIETTNKACGELKNTLETVRRLRSALLSDLLSGNHEIPASYDQFLGAA